MLDLSNLPIVDLDKVYLVSYYLDDKLIEFDKSYKDLKKFLVIGGPPPIKSSKVEIGTKVFQLPDDFNEFDEIKLVNGYLAFGVFLTTSIRRN